MSVQVGQRIRLVKTNDKWTDLKKMITSEPYTR